MADLCQRRGAAERSTLPTRRATKSASEGGGLTEKNARKKLPLLFAHNSIHVEGLAAANVTKLVIIVIYPLVVSSKHCSL